MKIVYIHGLGGAAMQSGTYKLLKQEFNNAIVLSPEVPHNPLQAKDWIKQYIEEEKPDLIVASSMGAFYTLQNNANIMTVVINPAMRAYTNLLEDAFGMDYIGKFKNGRLAKEEANGATFTLDMKYYEDLKIVMDSFLNLLESKEINKKVYAFFATDDELFHNEIVYKKYYGSTYTKIDHKKLGYAVGHHMDKKAIQEILIPKIKEIIQK